MNHFLLLIGLSLLSACSFNRSFYKPDSSSVLPFDPAESHYIHYGVSDSIHAIFYPNETATTNLFILHGNAGNLNSWSSIADHFHAEGYQIFMLDYPGFGNSSGKPTHPTVIASTDAAVHYFKELVKNDPKKNIAMGYSLGGNLAIKVATDHPDFFDALIIEAPFDSQRSAAINSVPRPFKFAPFLLAKNAINGNKLIAKWQKPLLIIHSQEDRVCAYKMSQRLIESAINTEQKEFWTIKGPHLAGLKLQGDLYLAKMKKINELIPEKN